MVDRDCSQDLYDRNATDYDKYLELNLYNVNYIGHFPLLILINYSDWCSQAERGTHKFTYYSERRGGGAIRRRQGRKSNKGIKISVHVALTSNGSPHSGAHPDT